MKKPFTHSVLSISSIIKEDIDVLIEALKSIQNNCFKVVFTGTIYGASLFQDQHNCKKKRRCYQATAFSIKQNYLGITTVSIACITRLKQLHQQVLPLQIHLSIR
jgi:hypothetical protein